MDSDNTKNIVFYDGKPYNFVPLVFRADLHGEPTITLTYKQVEENEKHYKTLTISKLEELCRQRQLPTAEAKKQDLVNSLFLYDMETYLRQFPGFLKD